MNLCNWLSHRLIYPHTVFKIRTSLGIQVRCAISLNLSSKLNDYSMITLLLGVCKELAIL